MNNNVQLNLGTQSMRINGDWMRTEDTGTGHEGNMWTETLHDTKDTEHSDSKDQATNAIMVADAENSETAAWFNTTDGDTINPGNHYDNVAEVDNSKDKAWVLLEYQYGFKSTGIPCMNNNGNPRVSMYMLNETPEELNKGPQEDGMEEEHQRLNVFIIL